MFEFSLAITAVVAALVLDYLFGEPRRYHPLVGLGKIIGKIERLCYPQQVQQSTEDSDCFEAPSPRRQRWRGVSAVLLVLSAPLLLALLLQLLLPPGHFMSFLLSAVVVYFCIGCRSLGEHAEAIAKPLLAGDIDGARAGLSMIVSRDTSECQEQEIAAGTIESVLENGSDAVIAPLFWFLVLGLPGIVAYRVINTLDAMWGYKNDQYLYFGWAAAKLDDVVNYLPARFCALGYAVCGQTRVALRCWRQQAKAYKSPNGGPVMAAGAGAIGVVVGGDAVYFGQSLARTELGEGRPPIAADIDASFQLLLRTIGVSLLLLLPFTL
ncbi:Cobalamin biosynthesis protein CobD [Sinobacterium norvegicum]|uniref:Cobalamin biosynthesis protein CobD n=1 Tax=Sinobacterium norvegicum TaxID=1641715 RepID=A0ABM9AFD4_9GAMM|nr:adenosylcobinamide-phosphate synthase CbiB [Sinobacterium norvegicum]CAH0991916.1 Cobalamin biosynthesis protein CobD [Sinobacterium norvegicum]